MVIALRFSLTINPLKSPNWGTLISWYLVDIQKLKQCYTLWKLRATPWLKKITSSMFFFATKALRHQDSPSHSFAFFFAGFWISLRLCVIISFLTTEFAEFLRREHRAGNSCLTPHASCLMPAQGKQICKGGGYFFFFPENTLFTFDQKLLWADESFWSPMR